jgi:uncharacterized RDD family membrane protein YckC
MNTVNPYAPPRASVHDVEDGAAALAGCGTRLVAVILDSIILVALVYLPLAVAIARNRHQLALANGHFNTVVFQGVGWLVLLAFVAWCWLTILFVARNGQSIAKKMLGIKVVRSDGSKASLGRIFLLRNVVNGLLAILPFYGFVDALLIFGEARQCVHDKIADTIVVKA